jgi:methionyl-tRNA formyltransferase
MQDDTQATAAPRIFRESARIAWSNPAAAVHNVIRGMNPTPVAWTMHRDSVLRIHRSKRCARPLDGPPGMLRVEDGRIEVACADEAIEILALQQPGHKALDAAAFLRGYKLLDGELFV